MHPLLKQNPGSAPAIISPSCYGVTTTSKIAGIVTYGLILVVSLVGNTLIVVIVYKTPALRKPINYFIANMAISDLQYSIFWLPWRMSDLYTNSLIIGGEFGQALCRFVPFFSNVSTEVSIQNLILMAVDRFEVVVFPLRPPLFRSKLCPFIILAMWVIAVAVNSSFLLAYQLVEYSGTKQCVLRWKKEFGKSSSYADYLLALYILFIYISVMLLAILYSIILIKMKTRVHPGEQSINTQQQRNRRNGRVFRMSVAIVLVFMICFLPLTTNVLILQYGGGFRHFSCGFLLYVFVTSYMASAYGAINPIICFIFSSNFRQGLKRLINGHSVAVQQ